ncbi:MAG: UDP-N-acetylmuramate--L-alanine ligase [Ruminococcaceae bacterium]|nr:UDP-N-acetylmuramate--L-alanine ligase [Oscillospiraceae bacterium]
MLQQDILQSVRRVHFTGIGGSGMCPLAEILFSLGYEVSGSDDYASDNLKRMQSLGIAVTLPLAAGNADHAELVVYTAAIPTDHPELASAAAKGIPLIERAVFLGLLTRRYPHTVSVAGTHGKTGTTSMLSQILLKAELDPSIFIGGRLPLINANGRAGKSDWMVSEACEFLDHYLNMKTSVAVILNVDADHLDYFGDLNGVIASFKKFAEGAEQCVIANADDVPTMQAVADIPPEKLITYGRDLTCDWSAQNIGTHDGAFGEYDLYHKGTFFAHIRLGVPGAHNVSNSMAAAAAAHLCGATAEQIAVGLATFGGAGRRFEFLGKAAGITVADDYAHHPTEITATLTAAKALPYRRVWAVFQPFTYSRTKRLLNEFAAALSLADEALVCDILGSREQDAGEVSSADITALMKNGRYLPTFEDVIAYLKDNAADGDLVLTMGGGNVYKCAQQYLRALQE